MLVRFLLSSAVAEPIGNVSVYMCLGVRLCVLGSDLLDSN